MVGVDGSSPFAPTRSAAGKFPFDGGLTGFLLCAGRALARWPRAWVGIYRPLRQTLGRERISLFRIPGPVGQWPLDGAIDDGTLWLGASPLPGPIQGLHGGPAGLNAPGLPMVDVPALPRRHFSGPPRLPLLSLDSRGADVERLQRLLNLRLQPCPNLRADGRFGPLTQAAVRSVQQAASLRVDGIAGKDTWRVLGTGTLWQTTHKAMPAAPAAKTAGPGHKGPAPAARPLVPQPAIPPAKPPAQAAAAKADIPSDDNVLSWSAVKKFQAVAMRAVDRLPGATRDELLRMISPMSIGITLGVWAASQFVGAGEVVDVIALLAGAVFLGWAVFNVASGRWP